MRHIIVTRYNVRTNFEGVDANSIRTDPEWLPNRKILFDKFCLPSLRAQTNQNFDWFVLFDEETPEDYTNYFSDVGTPILCRSVKHGHNLIRKRYESEGPRPTITTRVDNDDGLAKHYAEAVQTIGKDIIDCGSLLGLPHAINFRIGYEFDTRQINS